MDELEEGHRFIEFTIPDVNVKQGFRYGESILYFPKNLKKPGNRHDRRRNARLDRKAK